MYDLGMQFHFNIERAKAKNDAIIKGKTYRFTVLSERLIRIEYSKTGVFMDAPTELALCRDFDLPKFEVNADSKYLEISTKYFKLAYTKESPITASSLRISLLDTESMWYYGYPLVKAYDASLNALDEKESYEKGIYSVEGFSAIDDSKTSIIDPNGNMVKKALDSTDIYVFMYKDDFSLALQDYIKLTGLPPLIPRYALGNWWSKNYAYNEESLKKLFNRFEKEEIPISIFLMDTDWHITNNKYKTGYTFNRQLISNPNEFIDNMHQRGIRVGLSINPSEGIYPHEEMYNKVIEHIKVNPNSTIAFSPFNQKFVDVFLKVLLHPLEDMGVDFFWLDYKSNDKVFSWVIFNILNRVTIHG